MVKRVRQSNVVVVGGGTSGWMSAAYIERAFPNAAVTVIEAPSIPRMGVGEATIPNLDRALWQFLGIPESEWMPRVRATYKMGIKFANWNRPRGVDPDDHYWHLFGVMPALDGIPLPHYWNQQRLEHANSSRFDESCFSALPVAEQQLSPVDSAGTTWNHYAWHFDSNLMAEYLKEIALDRGVQLIEERVVDGKVAIDGTIESIVTDQRTEVSGDLFIDCTGFRALLIDKLLHEPFLDASNELLCNAAVATQIPEPRDDHGVDAFTTATALDNGWSWHIPLLGRIGTGYVYSDRHCTEEDAIAEFSKHLGIDGAAQDWNRIRFPVGRRERAWVGNCVAVGLAGNFLEPLESTALYLTYGALYQLVRFLPEGDLDTSRADRAGFNDEMAYSYDDCKDFVQLHYVASPRDDTQFWRDNSQLQVSDRLKEKLERYRQGELINSTTSSGDSYYSNFDYEFRNFWTEGSYYAVLTGLGVHPEQVNQTLREGPDPDAVRSLFDGVANQSSRAVQVLPRHRRSLEQLYYEDGDLIIDLRDRDR